MHRKSIKSFAGISFARRPAISREEAEENHVSRKLKKDDYKFSAFIEDTIEEAHKIFDDMKEGEDVTVLSNKLTMPGILRAYGSGAKEVYVGTFSMGTHGLSALKKCAADGAECYVLMDRSYLKKENFRVDTNKIVGEGVKFKFTKIHGKFLSMTYNDGRAFSVFGSSNFGPNLRLEVYHASRSAEEFEFWKSIYQNEEDMRNG